MLEAIADFWKPVKKVAPPQKLKLTDMQTGSTVSFGYVPQAALSGRKLTVTAINSYQFGQDVLTSFVLSNEKDVEVSMIIAEAQGEQYLAISRRISPEDRAKLFEDNAINIITGKNEFNKFTCRDNVPELKGWLVNSYKREIQGMKGFLHKADFRNGSTGLHSGVEFQYTLLGSNSNEHAIEIESYDDGHVDVYATIYRRTSDISEVVHVDQSQNKIIPTLSSPVLSSDAIPETSEETVEEISEAVVSDDKVEQNIESVAEPVKIEVVISEDFSSEEEAREHTVHESEISEPMKITKLELVELTQPVEGFPVTESKIEESKKEEETIEPIKNNNEEIESMSISAVTSNEPKISMVNGQSAVELGYKHEINTVGKAASVMDNESIECELRVANQIIDEAIRNEMRLSDVVRRIIELPVSHQEAVQIPINLADEDYSLLAIRYGIPASDRNAIKLRIIQDLADFSGSKKKS